MFCRRNCLAFLIAATVVGYCAFRPGKTARAEGAAEAAYGENDEETATHRFRTNQPRHWRHVMVAKH